MSQIAYDMAKTIFYPFLVLIPTTVFHTIAGPQIYELAHGVIMQENPVQEKETTMDGASMCMWASAFSFNPHNQPINQGVASPHYP